MTPDDVKNALEIITLIFNTAGAGLAFLKKLRDYVQARGIAIAVSDPTRGKPLGRIEARTTDEDIKRILPQ